MATLTYSPGGMTHLAPSDVLRTFGTITTHTPTDFAIKNVSSGYVVTFHSNSGNFAYDGFTHPIAGTIGGMQVADKNGHVYARMVGPFNDASLADFYTTLISSSANAAHEAFDQLAGYKTVVLGSHGADQIETYGQLNLLIGNGGNDTFHISDPGTTATGGRGNDTFFIDSGFLFNTDLNGGGGSNTLVINLPSVSFMSPNDHLSHISNFRFGPHANFMFIPTNNLPGGASPHIHLFGSPAPNDFLIGLPPTGPIPTIFNGSHIMATGFNDKDFATWELFGTAKSEHVTGAPNARNFFAMGDGNNTANGGNKDDIFHPGSATNHFDGKGGYNTVLFTGNKADYHIHKYKGGHATIIDLRPGHPEGTTIVDNVQELDFADKKVYLAPKHHSHSLAVAGLDQHVPFHPSDFDFHLWG